MPLHLLYATERRISTLQIDYFRSFLGTRRDMSHFIDHFALYQSQKEVRQLSSGKMRQDLLNRSTECRDSIFLQDLSLDF
jgi:hypothetical protein